MACYQNAQLGKPITFFTTQISSFFQNHISIVFIEGSSWWNVRNCNLFHLDLIKQYEWLRTKK